LTFLPFFNVLTGKNFTFAFVSSPVFLLACVLGWAGLTVLAGLYPAQYLSSFSPKEILKGTHSGMGGNSSLRKGLVIVQFAASIILIISTLVLYRQLAFMREKKLGFEPEQVIAIGTRAATSRDQVNSLKAAIEALPFVKSAARSQAVPGEGGSGRTLPPLDNVGEAKNLTTVRATPEIVDVLGIKLLAGKSLPEKNPGDTTVQVVLNKSAVDFLGLTPEDAINRKIEVYGFGERVEVTGVIEDFNFTSLREPIGAYAFHNAPTEGYSVLVVKLATDDPVQAIARIESEFKKIIPSAFEYTFLDQYMLTLYNSEEQLAQVILVFSGLAIFIACLGLYALAAYTTEQRTKEIGIRKVMGASIFQLSTMLSTDFIKLVLISFAVAVPVGYFAMNKWLEGFAYRVEISWAIFLIAGVISVLIAWFTVGFESLKAARSNPMKSLRTE
ncbi:MAG TPA: FtsX-like permease family protein, partial [Cyclobacteriaceae bacterium]|nr:FtsX-like permease family protein [Cyclobacteriaceae bacterium]